MLYSRKTDKSMENELLDVVSKALSCPVEPPPVDSRVSMDLTPEKVIFNPPATIVYWNDGTKTVVRADNDVFSEEFGYAMACMRKIYGSRGKFKAQFKNALRPQQKPSKPKQEVYEVIDEPTFEIGLVQEPQTSTVPSLNQMLRDLAGDDSMGVRIGFHTKNA